MPKVFPSLCCGYFKTCSTIGYESRLIILTISDSGANGEGRGGVKMLKKADFTGFSFLFFFFFVVAISLQEMLSQFTGVLNAPWAAKSRVYFQGEWSNCLVIAAEVGQLLWSLKFIDPVIIMALIMECVTINRAVSPDRVIVFQSQRSGLLNTATMTSCCGRCEACSNDQAGGFWEG